MGDRRVSSRCGCPSIAPTHDPRKLAAVEPSGLRVRLSLRGARSATKQSPALRSEGGGLLRPLRGLAMTGGPVPPFPVPRSPACPARRPGLPTPYGFPGRYTCWNLYRSRKLPETVRCGAVSGLVTAVKAKVPATVLSALLWAVIRSSPGSCAVLR